MITVTGQFAGESISPDKPKAVNAKQLAEHFNLPLPKNGKPLLLRINPRKVSIDSFGQKHVPEATHIRSKMVNVYSPKTEDVIDIEFKGQGVNRYGRVSFTGEQMYVPATDIERAIWMLLSTECRESPFRDPRKPWTYCLFDSKAQNQAEFDVNKQRMSVAAEITSTMPWDALEVRAKGIRVRGEGVLSAVKDGEMAARVALFALLNKYPEDFIKAWSNDKTTLDGRIQHALDKAWIVNTSQGGSSYWRWNGTKGDSQITKIPPDQDSFAVLRSAALTNSEIEQQIIYLIQYEKPPVEEVYAAPKYNFDRPDEAMIEAEKATSPAAARATDEERKAAGIHDILVDGEALNLCSFNEGSLEVYQLKDGIIKDTLCVVSGDDVVELGSWKQAAAKILADPHYNPKVHSLRMAVHNKKAKSK
jgi:hypothetical protein